WPLMCVLSLCVAATMGQVASAFPTAGGLYHWAAILGGRGWGWATAWFNLAGLVTVLAAINVGTVLFAAGAFYPGKTLDPLEQLAAVAAVTASQALLNHLGIRVTRVLTDFSGYWILIVAGLLTAFLVVYTDHLDFAAGHGHELHRAARGRQPGVGTNGIDRVGVRAGAVAPGVHDHRLRRLGPHLGGNRQGGRERAPRDRPVGTRLRGVRVGDALCRGAGDPGPGGNG